MYRRHPPTWAYAGVAAMVGAVLLAQGHIVGGAVLVVIALILGFAWDRTVRDEDDHSGFYGN
ncbi:MAG TPA: hypothetical protein VGF74_18530 [Thermoleophilaceae bacterium]